MIVRVYYYTNGLQRILETLLLSLFFLRLRLVSLKKDIVNEPVVSLRGF